MFTFMLECKRDMRYNEMSTKDATKKKTISYILAAIESRTRFEGPNDSKIHQA